MYFKITPTCSCADVSSKQYNILAELCMYKRTGQTIKNVVTGDERSGSRIRGWIFTGALILIVIAAFSITAVLVAYPIDDCLAIYHNMDMDTISYCPRTFVVFCLIEALSLEIFLGIDILIGGLMDVATIYLSILTMKLWLSQIWFVKLLLDKIDEFGLPFPDTFHLIYAISLSLA